VNIKQPELAEVALFFMKADQFFSKMGSDEIAPLRHNFRFSFFTFRNLFCVWPKPPPCRTGFSL